jgi:poly(A) polymerase Pap1
VETLDQFKDGLDLAKKGYLVDSEKDILKDGKISQKTMSWSIDIHVVREGKKLVIRIPVSEFVD